MEVGCVFGGVFWGVGGPRFAGLGGWHPTGDPGGVAVLGDEGCLFSAVARRFVGGAVQGSAATTASLHAAAGEVSDKTAGDEGT